MSWKEQAKISCAHISGSAYVLPPPTSQQEAVLSNLCVYEIGTGLRKELDHNPCFCWSDIWFDILDFPVAIANIEYLRAAAPNDRTPQLEQPWVTPVGRMGIVNMGFRFPPRALSFHHLIEEFRASHYLTRSANHYLKARLSIRTDRLNR